MPIHPGKDESQSEWMSRCVPDMLESGDREQDQAVAACLQMWRDRNKAISKQVPDPDPDETRSEFMSRCLDELEGEDDAREQCALAWDESRSISRVITKTHSETVQGMEFVLSDDSVDRIGDVVSATGWELDNFKKNPIALFSHIPSFIVGRWHNLRVEKNALRGRLELAPKGTSERIDEIRKLVEAGILRAVSVGFRALQHEPLDAKDPWKGTRFLKQELVECSLVAIPANASALAIAKSLNISASTLDLVVAKSGRENGGARAYGSPGKSAATSHAGKGGAMSLSQRITELEVKIVAARDALREHWTDVDDSNVSDAEMEKANELNHKITTWEKQRDNMIASEKILAGTTAGNGQDHGHRDLTIYHSPLPRDPVEAKPAAPAIVRSRGKDEDPVNAVTRAIGLALAAKVWGKPLEEVRMMVGKEYREYESDLTKAMCEIVLRAATAPAMTTVTGWAAELAQQVWVEPMPTLFPSAVYSRLAARGMSLNFGRAGRINIPTRSRTPTIAGSFVGEGMAIPVRQGLFTTQFLVPKKLGVITTFTREMSIHSLPAIEPILREAIQDDTRVAIDSVLLDANAATAIRPAGLLNGVSATTATTGPGFPAIIGDIKALSAALITNTAGNVRNPTWIMNPGDINSAKLAVATNTGEFPFKAELEAGRFNGWPVIESGTVTARTVILIDAADFVTATGEGPTFAASDQATVHMEDSNPLELVGTGTPGTVASPQRSMFQTDSLAIRMTWDLNWLMRRTGMIAWTQTVNW